jgi:hypothetical protein
MSLLTVRKERGPALPLAGLSLPWGLRWGGPPQVPTIFSFFYHLFEKDSALISLSHTSAEKTVKSKRARERTKARAGRATRLPTPPGYGTSTHHSSPKEQLALQRDFMEIRPSAKRETRVQKTKRKNAHITCFLRHA